MDDFEQRIRESLRRVDGLQLPAELDPEEIAARDGATRSGFRSAPRWLAAAAAVVLVGGLGFWSWSGRDGATVPAIPAESPSPTPALASDLIGPTWQATAIWGEPVTLGGEAPFVEFHPGDVLTGYGGCNWLSGRYELVAAKLSFPRLGSTTSVCTGAVGDQDGRFFKAVIETAQFHRDGESLELADSTGTVLASFRRLPRDEDATVMVDIFSGRQNPETPLEPALVDELFSMLEDQGASLVPIKEPDLKLGFRGFVVTSPDESRPSLRISPRTVYVVTGGSWEELADPEQNFYSRLYAAIDQALADDVREAIPKPVPGIPDVTAPVPPLRGAVANWELIDPESVGPGSVKLVLGVSRLGCSNGKTGELLEPVVSVGVDEIVIRTDAEPLGEGPFRCPGNDMVEVELDLPEPVGDRLLVDAACLEGEGAGTGMCANGAVRWRP